MACVVSLSVNVYSGPLVIGGRGGGGGILTEKT